MTLRRSCLSVLAFAIAGGCLSAQMSERLTARLHTLRSAEQLGADDDFREVRQHMDDGAVVHHLQQRHRGIKVWGAHTNVREDFGEMQIAAKKVFKGINIGTEPSLAEADVLDVVDHDLRNAQAEAFAPRVLNSLDIALEGAASESAAPRHHSKPEIELAVLPIEEMRVLPSASGKLLAQLNAEDVTYVVTGYRLVYHVATDADLQGRREMMNYLVDAHSGEIVKKWNLVKHSTATGTANTKYSGTVTLYTNLNGSNYEAKDPVYCNNYVVNSSGTLYTDADNTWGNGGNWADGTTVAKQTGAAEALYVLQRECQMLQAVFGRNGSSGTGTAMKVFWSKDPASNTACYITQNYITSGYADSYFYDMNKLDIIGHEYGHSLDYYTAYLCYDDSGEAGGMGEAHGDIMGLLTEVYAKYASNSPTNPTTVIPEAGLTDPDTWLCGEDAVKSNVNGGKALRFFIKPSLDTMEGTIDAWKSTMASVEVHAATGPTDRMFYYLAAGAPSDTTHDGYTTYLPNGSNGIGLHKAAMIWYKALTGGSLSSSSKHTDARNACIAAAKTLYGAGGPEEQAVWNAYHGVNVGAAWSDSTVPVIATQPQSQTVSPGVSVTFTVAVSGGTAPYTYQWYKNGAAVSGATAASYTFTPTTADNGATFYVKVTDSASTPSSVTSSTATLTVSSTATYNEVESNGSTSAANAVPDASTKIVGYIGSSTDNDYFKVKVGAGVTLTVNMTGPTGKDYDLYLYNSSGRLLKSSTGTTATETVTYKNTGRSAVNYYIRSKGYNGAYSTTTPYNLALTR